MGSSQIRRLNAAAGMHRFVWDLHHGGRATVLEDSSGPKGVWAPPGRYTVELRADGKVLREPLTVVTDPRVKVEPAALVEEFELASKVQNASKQVAAAVKDATALLKTLPHGDKATLRPQVAAVATRISAISGIPLPWDRLAGRSTAPPPLGSLKDLAKRFDNLQEAVDGADAAPSPDVRAAYDALQNALSKQLQLWDELKQTDFAILNGDAQPGHAH